MIPSRQKLLSSAIGAAALVVIVAPAQSAVFDEPAPSALLAAQHGLDIDKARESAEPTTLLLIAQRGPPESPPGPPHDPPGPPPWAGGKPPSTPPVSPRRPHDPPGPPPWAGGKPSSTPPVSPTKFSD